MSLAVTQQAIVRQVDEALKSASPSFGKLDNAIDGFGGVLGQFGVGITDNPQPNITDLLSQFLERL